MEAVSIENPQLWRLVLGIDAGEVHALATSTVADSSLIYRRIALDSGPSLNRALEEAVYASPWLLNDFGQIDIVVSGMRYTLAPTSLGDDALVVCAEAAQLQNEDSEDIKAVVQRDDTESATVLWTMEENSHQFLLRTFRGAPMQHAVTPMLRWFGKQAQQGNGAKIFVNIGSTLPPRIDIFAYRKGARLALATTKIIESENDALYYIAGASKLAEFDAEHDRILLCGDASLRSRISVLAGRYFRHVMPLIFPSAALRAGRDAFKAPFPLIILPLCE